MEKLKDYLMALPVSERRTFSETCGTSWPYLRNVVYGFRPAGEKLCVRIEQATNGKVTRQDLRPHDWREIWPELDAPVLPTHSQDKQEPPHA